MKPHNALNPIIHYLKKKQHNTVERNVLLFKETGSTVTLTTFYFDSSVKMLACWRKVSLRVDQGVSVNLLQNHVQDLFIFCNECKLGHLRKNAWHVFLN